MHGGCSSGGAELGDERRGGPAFKVCSARTQAAKALSSTRVHRSRYQSAPDVTGETCAYSTACACSFAVRQHRPHKRRSPAHVATAVTSMLSLRVAK